MRMKKQAVDAQILIRYLLGEMSEGEQMALEEKYFGDASLFEQLQDAEDELIHRYVNNELPAPQRRLFEQHLLARPWKRDKVKLAQALKIYVAKAQGPQRAATAAFNEKIISWLRSFTLKPALAWPFAVAMAAMIFFSARLFFEAKDLQTQLEAAQLAFQQREQELLQQAETQREQNKALTGQLHNEQDQRAALESQMGQSQRLPLTISLVPGASRSSPETAQQNRLQIGPEVQLVRLQLHAGSAALYENFRFVLETAAGDTLLTQHRLSAQPTAKGRAVIVSVPASMLSVDDYLITLYGVLPSQKIEEAGHYSFSVMK
jgi:hypothetical protein